jgi:hypothetical protein
MSDQQTTLNKIKKLLAMKRGGTQHEAETAEALAQALALKAGIDLARVNVDDSPAAEQAITHRTIGDWANIPCEVLYAAQICTRFFNVHSITLVKIWHSEMVFIGTDSDLDITGCVFKFLVREFRWQWNHRRGRCRKRVDFLSGAYCGLFSKLNERFGSRSPSTEGLVLHHAAKRGRDIEIRDGLKPAPQAEPAPRLNGHTGRKLLQPANGQLGLL